MKTKIKAKDAIKVRILKNQIEEKLKKSKLCGKEMIVSYSDLVEKKKKVNIYIKSIFVNY